MKHIDFFNPMKRMAFAVLLGMFVIGCTPKQPEQQEVGASEQDVTIVESPVEEVVLGAEDESGVVEESPADNSSKGGDICFSPGPKGGDLAQRLEPYCAMIEASDTIKLGNSGFLKVWMGKEKYMPKPNPDFVRDTTSWYSYAGLYARITPDAKGFKIDPSEPVVVKLDSTGSGFQFTITPEKKGEFQVSATVELFETEACLGAPVIKPAQTLTVKVYVDYVDEILKPIWDYFMRFWYAFVPLFFGALFFVIRKFVKKKTGYTEKKNVFASTEEENVKDTED